MMSSGSGYQTNERDKLTVALFKRICHEKAQERELLKCPRCDNVLEAIPLDTDDRGDQNIMWICKSTADRSCSFPLDMPTDVFWVKRSAQQQEDGVMPRPNIQLLPEKYRYMYPSLFPESFRPSLMGSRCASSNSRTSASSGASLHTRDMSLSSNMASPTNSNYGREREFSAPPSVIDGDYQVATTSRDEDEEEFIITDISNCVRRSAPAPQTETVDIAADQGRSSSVEPLLLSTPPAAVAEQPSADEESPSTTTAMVPLQPTATVTSQTPEPSPNKRMALDKRLFSRRCTIDYDNDSTFDSDEEEEYQTAMAKADRRAAAAKAAESINKQKELLNAGPSALPAGSRRTRPLPRPSTPPVSLDSFYVHLLDQLDSMDLDSMEDEELTALVERVMEQVNTAQAPLPPGRGYTPTAEMLNRAEYVEMARQSFQNIDFLSAGAIASKQPKRVRMSMPFSVRRAATGFDVLAAVGASHRGVKRKQPADDSLAATIQERVDEIVRLLAKRRRENKRQLQRAVQTTESEASLRGVRASTQHLAAKDRERLETDRAHQMQLEQEHKTKQLVKAKIHAIKEARKERLLAQQLEQEAAAARSSLVEEEEEAFGMDSLTGMEHRGMDESLAGDGEMLHEHNEEEDPYSHHHQHHLFGDDDLFGGDVDLF